MDSCRGCSVVGDYNFVHQWNVCRYVSWHGEPDRHNSFGWSGAVHRTDYSKFVLYWVHPGFQNDKRDSPIHRQLLRANGSIPNEVIVQLANQDLIIKDHTDWFPNTSFGDRGPSLDWIAEAGYYVISVWKDHDQKTEKLVSAAPHLFDGMCCLVNVEPLTIEELQSRIDTQWAVIRHRRNQMLKDLDWTQGKDIPDSISDPAAILRQALRDITKQLDPFNIDWPK